MPKEKIFIASNSLDRPTTGAVAGFLTEHGYDPVVYETDMVASGEDHLGIYLGPAGVQVLYQGETVYPAEYAAAWLRRPRRISQQPSDDIAREIGLDKERFETQRFIWESIPEDRWLNVPRAIYQAQQKIPQLLVARSLGFTIPTTVVSNSLDTINALLPAGNIISKLNNVLVPTKDGYTHHFTKVYSESDRNVIPGFPFPGIWQPQVPKSREWRITYVDGESFDAAIYTSDEAKTTGDPISLLTMLNLSKRDSRKPKNTNARPFSIIMGLKYGAFDFAEDAEGRLTFFEMNPNGQYGWLEDRLGFPISQRLGAALIRIAERLKP